MSLQRVVELYRVCGKPPLNGPTFAFTTTYPMVQALVAAIRSDSHPRLDDLEIDGQEILPNDPWPNTGQQIHFSLRLPTSSSSTFHKNLQELLNRDQQVSRGQLPDDYYLIDEDFYSGDTRRPEAILALGTVCRLINAMFKLAHYHDQKSNNGYLRLVFIQPANGITIKPVELDTKVTPAIVQAAKNIDPHLVEELSQSSPSNDPHYSAKVGVFGTCLATFVGGRPDGDAFEYLVTNWQNFIKSYHRDLSTYLSGFAFHKVKREVAEAQLKITAEFSKVLGDISGKVIGIPITVAVIATIPKAATFVEQLLILLGIIIACLIISKTVENQERQFSRIKNAKNLIIGAIEGEKESYPRELAQFVDKFTADLAKEEQSLEKSLKIFRALSYLPIFISIFVIENIYLEKILEWLLRLL